MDFIDADTYESLLGSAPFEYGPGGVIRSAGWDVDVIGDSEVRIVSWDKEGTPTTEPIGGFLVNLRSEDALPDSLTKYQVFPQTPIRVWA